MTASSPSIPALASVVFVKVQQFGRRSVAEQARLRIQLEAVLAVAIAPLRVEDRIVLDAPDGVALVVLADPEGALDAAERSLAASAGLPLCIGVNHGPVVVAADGPDGQALGGDGIHSAAIVAGFAEPSRVLVSRSFREALGETAPDREAALRSAGIFTDPTVRTHELLTPDRDAARTRRRRLLAVGVAVAAGLLALGAVLRDVVPRQPSAPPALLLFNITPEGEVFIDGDSEGTSPPLAQLELDAGLHTIEVRYGEFPPYRVQVNLKPGEQVTIRHAFARRKSPLDALRRLGDKLKGD